MSAWAAIPVVGGAVAGGYGEYQANKAKKKGYKEMIAGMEDLQSFIKTQSGQRERESKLAYDPFLQNFGENAKDYYDTLANLDLSQYDVGPRGKFDFNMQQAIEESMNPEIEAIINRGTGAVESSAASRGTLRSGATQKQVARSTADITAQEYNKAADRAQQQYQNKYQNFVDNWNSELQGKQFNRQGALEGVNAKGKLYDTQSGMFGRSRDEMTGIQSAADQGVVQTKGQIAQSRADLKSAPSDFQAALQGTVQGASAGASMFGAFK